MTMKGCCNCGSIKIDIKGVPSNHEKRPTRYCHCTTCRRASSGPGQYLLSIDEDLVEISDPQGLKKSWKDTSTNSGTPADRRFCGSCGTYVHQSRHSKPLTIPVHYMQQHQIVLARSSSWRAYSTQSTKSLLKSLPRQCISGNQQSKVQNNLTQDRKQLDSHTTIITLMINLPRCDLIVNIQPILR